MAEDQQQQPNKEQHMHFTIGKSYGLSNQPTKIEDYKAKFTKIREALIKTVQDESDAVIEAADKLVKELQAKYVEVSASQQKIVIELSNMNKKIADHNFKLGGSNQKLQEMVDEVLNLAVTNYRQNIKVLAHSENQLLTRIDEFSRRWQGSIDVIEKKRNEFIEQLQKDRMDIREFEKGYIYGDALRIALSENKNGSK